MTHQWVSQLHKEGRLVEALRLGRTPLKVYNSKYRRLYGKSGKELAIQLNINERVVKYHHERGTLAKKIEYGWRHIGGSIWVNQYGMSLEAICNKLQRNKPVVRWLHQMDRLAEALRVGKVVRKQTNCKYRRKYGLSIPEIATLLGCGKGLVSRMEARGLLEAQIT